MANKKNNQLAKKTRRSIKQSYIELLHSKPPNKISITEICEHAEVSRPTFYAHFESKDEILIEYVGEILQPIYEEIELIGNKTKPKDVANINREFFNLWKKNSQVYLLIKTANLDYFIKDLHKQMLIKSVYLENLQNKFPINDPDVVEYIFSYYVEAAFSVLNKWMERGMQQSVDDMGELIAILLNSDVIESVSKIFSEPGE